MCGIWQGSRAVLFHDRMHGQAVAFKTGKLFKTWKRGAPSVKLCSLPPTNDAFVENINKCQLQVATWKAVLPDTLTMDPTSHGWELDHQGILLPRTVPTGTLSIPADILKLIHSNCKTSGCLTAPCICSKV